jgi:hypothetical protein
MLYEVHITIDENQYIQLRNVCMDQTQFGDKLKCILVKNTSGIHQWQLIATAWVNCTEHQQAIGRAHEIADVLRQHDLTILRTKVEIELHNVDEKYVLEPKQYFEFHMKVPIQHAEQYEALKRLGTEHDILWSTLVQSKTMDFIPISTIRSKTGTYSEAVKRKSEWLRALRENNFQVDVKMHQELCIFDDWLEIDNGWVTE